MQTSIVIIPTYNERENVEKIIRQVLSYDALFSILIIDDNSPDGTAAIVEGLLSEFPNRIFIEKRPGKLGLGTAYIHGFKWALAKGFTYIFEMDCDFSHNPDDLERLLKPLQTGNYQLSIGSRYCKGGKVKNWPWDRILLSYFASIYVRLILWVGIKDTTAGFMCYHKDVLSTIDFDKIHFKGYAFQICMKYATKKNGFKVIEVPITFIDRQFGESKMSTGIFKEAVIGVWKMRKMKFK
ncbi:MAG: polyprenol monophosphomannose synthase [Flavobacteriia bacterium]|nr:polyprenol monophosphomannose synthase [Flavobacteriia bacterium]OJX34900.1 MAG: dolichyl-phosphate beta-D-mannosyltransferase [Flavobacteriia bacterium 40-80]